MRFSLSGPSPLNATYTNTSGQAIYKTSTPRVLIGHTTTISRVLPADLPQHAGGSSASDQVHLQSQEEGRFGHLATVRHFVGRSVISYGGEEIKSGEHFKKVGPLWRCVFHSVDYYVLYLISWIYLDIGNLLEIKPVQALMGRPTNGLSAHTWDVRYVRPLSISCWTSIPSVGQIQWLHPDIPLNSSSESTTQATISS